MSQPWRPLSQEDTMHVGVFRRYQSIKQWVAKGDITSLVGLEKDQGVGGSRRSLRQAHTGETASIFHMICGLVLVSFSNWLSKSDVTNAFCILASFRVVEVFVKYKAVIQLSGKATSLERFFIFKSCDANDQPRVLL